MASVINIGLIVMNCPDNFESLHRQIQEYYGHILPLSESQIEPVLRSLGWHRFDPLLIKILVDRKIAHPEILAKLNNVVASFNGLSKDVPVELIRVSLEYCRWSLLEAKQALIQYRMNKEAKEWRRIKDAENQAA